MGPQLEAIARLPFNWDGRLSLPIRPDVPSVVRWFFSPRSGVTHRLPIPSVKPRPDGTIRVGFVNGKRGLALIFLCEGVIKSACITKGGLNEAALDLKRDGSWVETLAEHYEWFSWEAGHGRSR